MYLFVSYSTLKKYELHNIKNVAKDSLNHVTKELKIV